MEEASEVLGQDLKRREVETNMSVYRQQCSLIIMSVHLMKFRYDHYLHQLPVSTCHLHSLVKGHQEIQKIHALEVCAIPKYVLQIYLDQQRSLLNTSFEP